MSGSATSRILVIRGGALGDFILTLPAIGLLRAHFPDARIEILGYRAFLALAEGRHYADTTRSIEYGPLAAFFSREGDLPADLSAYFGGFAHVFSYLYDPDRIFEANLRRVGVRNLVSADPRPAEGLHAAYHLAQPMERYALFLEDPAAIVHPTDADRAAALSFLEGMPGPFAALHPGSGSPRKNWPPERWIEVVRALPGSWHWVVTGGEADADLPERIAAALPPGRCRVARSLALPVLAALFASCRLYLGNDSGISHLAAAAGAPCVLVFGPSDPSVWAPRNRGVSVVTAPGGDPRALEPGPVLAAARVRAGVGA